MCDCFESSRDGEEWDGFGVHEQRTPEEVLVLVTHEPQHFKSLVLIRIVKDLLWCIKGSILIHVAKTRSISKFNGRY